MMSLVPGAAAITNVLLNARMRRRQRMRNEHFEYPNDTGYEYQEELPEPPRETKAFLTFLDITSKIALLAFACFYFAGWLGLVRPRESENRLKIIEDAMINMQYTVKSLVELHARTGKLEEHINELILEQQLIKQRMQERP